MAWLADAPIEATADDDRRELELVGLRLPVRASIAIAVTTLVLLLDLSRTLLPDSVIALGRAPEAMRAVALERALLFGLVPLAIVVLVFRDRPARYGLTVGDWRAGVPLALVGSLVMTPIVLSFATLPEVRAYYAESGAAVVELAVTNTLDLVAAEFLYRGFLMLTLLRVIGPIAILVAAMPFAFSHVGKPELEVLSTLIGGIAYGWLAWRTRSIAWGAIAHVYILVLVTVGAAGHLG
jgi:membrane protease YdiL (CAAX protease family)